MSQNRIDIRKVFPFISQGVVVKEAIHTINFSTVFNLDSDFLIDSLISKVAKGISTSSLMEEFQVKDLLGMPRNSNVEKFRKEVAKNIAYDLQRIVIFLSLVPYDNNLLHILKGTKFNLPSDVIELIKLVNMHSIATKVEGSDSYLIPKEAPRFVQQIIGSKGGRMYRNQFFSDMKRLSVINSCFKILGENSEVTIEDLNKASDYFLDVNYNVDYDDSGKYPKITNISYDLPHGTDGYSLYLNHMLMPTVKMDENVEDFSVNVVMDVDMYSLYINDELRPSSDDFGKFNYVNRPIWVNEDYLLDKNNNTIDEEDNQDIKDENDSTKEVDDTNKEES